MAQDYTIERKKRCAGNTISVDLAYYSSVLQNMNEIKAKKQFCDIVLKVGSNELECHKIVLASTIPYFNCMFSNEMAESTKRVIEMNDVNFETLQIIVDFAYTGKMVVNMHNVEEILVASSYLQVTVIQEECVRFMMKNINADNVFHFKKISEIWSYKNLFESCQNYILYNYATISECSDFLSLALNELLSIIKQDDVCVEREEIIFESVMKWIFHDEISRSKMLPELLSEVRFKYIQPKYLSEKIYEDPLVKASNCKITVDNSNDFKTRVIFSPSDILCIVGGFSSRGGFLSYTQKYRMKANKLEFDSQMKSMGHRRFGGTVTTYQGKIYAMGGKESYQTVLKSLESYDVDKNRWTNRKAMNSKRYFPSCCTVGDRIYVCGGSVGYDYATEVLSSAECYCPATNQWHLITPMNSKRHYIGVTSLMGRVWALGGIDEFNNSLTTTESFDPRESVWRNEKEMLNKRNAHSVTSFKEKIYVCGGYNNLLEEYDPRNCQWRNLSPMKHSRYQASLVAYLGHLYCVGGHDEHFPLTSIEVYDTATDTWSAESLMETDNYGFSAVVLPYNM